MKNNRETGFTLVEVIVVAGIIAILAGILVPLILKEIDEARITRAYADARSISAGILILKKDTGKWPNMANSGGSCGTTATFVYGEGTLPAGLAAQGYDQTTSVALDDYLVSDGTGCYGARWKGPYMAHTAPDPWGNAYIINAASFEGGGAVWILSAGPDGTVDTPAASGSLQGDDVGIMITRKNVAL